MLQLLAVTAALATPGLPAEFPEPEALAPKVAFWERVYSEWESRHVVIHDRQDLGIVYRVVDLGTLAPWPAPEDEAQWKRDIRARRTIIGSHLQEVAGALRRLAAASDLARAELEGVDAEVYDALAAAGALDRIEGATRRLRWQYGLADRFRAGLDRFDAWAPQVRQAFRAEGVPEALVALGFVESLFDPSVYSKVGAAGLFQLMPRTASELGLTRSPLWDERLDPVRAAEGAARMLRQNYEMLGSWPLALTGYNHGPYGVRRAVKTLGSRDLVELIERYESPSWGFASQNFYSEFLAARRVLADRRRFGDWVAVAPETDRRARTPGVAHLDALASAGCADPEEVRRLNPALLSPVLAGEHPLPQGYPLRLPEAADPARFTDCAAGVALQVLPPPREDLKPHRVRKGDTLWALARRYRTTVATLQQLNDLGPDGYLRAGQTLQVPVHHTTGSLAGRMLLYPQR